MGSKGHGDGIRRLDDGAGKDKKVGYVGKNVAEYDEREGRVDYTREVAGWVLELSCDVVDLRMLVNAS